MLHMLICSSHLEYGLTIRILLKTDYPRTSLVVQWLRLCTLNAGGPGVIPGKGTRFHTLQLRVHMPQVESVPICCFKDPVCSK